MPKGTNADGALHRTIQQLTSSHAQWSGSDDSPFSIKMTGYKDLSDLELVFIVGATKVTSAFGPM